MAEERRGQGWKRGYEVERTGLENLIGQWGQGQGQGEGGIQDEPLVSSLETGLRLDSPRAVVRKSARLGRENLPMFSDFFTHY